MVRFLKPDAIARRICFSALLLSGVCGLLASPALAIDSLFPGQDLPAPTPAQQFDRGTTVSVLSPATQPTEAATPREPVAAALSSTDNPSGISNVTLGGVETPSLTTDYVAVAPVTASPVAETAPPPRPSSQGFDPLSPEGLAMGAGALVVLVAAGWWFSRRRAY